MGCDITSVVEVRENDLWHVIYPEFKFDEHMYTNPFPYRSYSLFAFLAGVRNYSKIKPLIEQRGLPEDISDGAKGEFGYWDTFGFNSEPYFTWNSHYGSFSHIYLKELIDFDYTQELEDRRYNGDTLPEGEGVKMTYDEYIGGHIEPVVKTLTQLGKNPEDVRIVFAFDN